MRYGRELVVMAGVALLAGTAGAQTTGAVTPLVTQAPAESRPAAKQPVRFYDLQFVVKELEGGKVVNSRSYMMVVSGSGGVTTGTSRSIRAGSRVPVQTGPGQFNYMDVGVNIDCHSVREEDGGLALLLTAEVSGPSDTNGASSDGHPVVRQTRWSSDVIVPLRKSTLVFSSDDPVAKRTMQLELLATPVK